MDQYMKVGFCRKCGRAIILYPAAGADKQNDWDKQATEVCGCMQIKLHGKTVTVREIRQLDISDIGI